jgi:hypothetical protein
MLHKYIRAYVKDTFRVDIAADRNHIVGHFEINPIEKPYCPGKAFPFDSIIKELNGVVIENLPFTDIANHWAKGVIIEATKLGIVKGDGDKTFEPDKPMTRAEAVQIAINVYKLCKGGN